MRRKIAWAGLDVHKDSIKLLVYIGNSKEEELFETLQNPQKLLRFLKRLSEKYTVRACYEAGCCGFFLYRKLKTAGIDCMVVAPSLIPSTSSRVKTDKKDARKLAQYLRSGLLTPVTVPDIRLEGDRDLIRFRASIVKEQTRAKQFIRSFLLRKGIKFTDSPKWSKKFLLDLRNLELPIQDRMMLNRYLSHYEYQKSMVDEVTLEIEELSRTEKFNEMATILRGFRGIETVTAMTILTHVPDFRAFHSPKKLMSYAGLTPSEFSSGEKTRRGAITKAGNCLLRKSFITAAHQYIFPDRCGKTLRKKREHLTPFFRSLVERADRRCRKRKNALSLKGKPINLVKTAIARELTAFIWEAIIYHLSGELKETA